MEEFAPRPRSWDPSTVEISTADTLSVSPKEREKNERGEKRKDDEG